MAKRAKGSRPSRGPIATEIASALAADPRLNRPRTGRKRTRKGSTVRSISVATRDGMVKGTVYVLDSKPPDITVRLNEGGGRYSSASGAVAGVRSLLSPDV